MTRTRAQGILATLTVIAVVVLLGGAPATAAAPAVAGSLQLSDATVAPATTLTLTGNLPPRRSRTVKLQSRISGSWVVLATKKSTERRPVLVQHERAHRCGPDALPGPRPGDHPRRQEVRRAGHPGPHAHGGDHDLRGRRRAPRVRRRQRPPRLVLGQQHLGGAGRRAGGRLTTKATHSSRSPCWSRAGNWAAISAMGGSTCGLKRDNTAWCWGDRGAYHDRCDRRQGPGAGADRG